MLHLEIDETEVVRLRDIFSFPPIFWFCSIVCLAYYVAIFPFISLGQVFFMKKFDMSSSEANFINGKVNWQNNFIRKCHVLNLKFIFLYVCFFMFSIFLCFRIDIFVVCSCFTSIRDINRQDGSKCYILLYCHFNNANLSFCSCIYISGSLHRRHYNGICLQFTCQCIVAHRSTYNT